MPIEPLNDRALIRIGGEEAEHFLNNLVTCEIENASPERALFGGLLTPQGKILFDFFVLSDHDGYLLDCPMDLRDELIKRLTFYRLRAKVSIEPVDLAVHAVWSDRALLPVGFLTAADSRHEAMGWRVYGWQPDKIAKEGAEDYLTLRVRLGIPEGGIDYAYGDAFPHDALFDQFGGVDFTKGCYVGQEVVSRMQHRSTARKRVVKVSGGEDLPPTGTNVSNGTQGVGHLGSVAGKHGLALLRLDKVKKAIDGGETISAGSVDVEVSLPDWVSFDWPQ